MSIEKKHGNNLLIAAVFCKKDAAYQASRKRETAASFCDEPPFVSARYPTNNGFVFVVMNVSDRIAFGCYHKERADNCDCVHCYRLCVLASGSLITDIFSCCTRISVSCLHLGQNRGKFSSIVSLRTFNLVLFSQRGHNSQSTSSPTSSPPTSRLYFRVLLFILFCPYKIDGSDDEEQQRERRYNNHVCHRRIHHRAFVLRHTVVEQSSRQINAIGHRHCMAYYRHYAR